MARYYVSVENENGRVVGTSSNERLLITMVDGNRVVSRMVYGRDGIQVVSNA